MSEGLRGWREYHLNEIYTFTSGLSKSRDQFGFGFPFLSFKEVFNNFFLPKKLGNLANTSVKERMLCSIKKGDVFLTRTSETQEELGMSSVALIDYPEATFNGFTKRLRPIGHIALWPEYTGYYFRSPYFRATVTSMSSMTTRASLNNDMMSALKIMVPPLPEQKAIAALLSSLDDKIDLLHRQNNTLESMAETLFRQWFIEEAQEKWENCELADLCKSIACGGTPSTKIEAYYTGDINWYSTKELNDNFLFESISKITTKGLENSAAKLFPAGTVVMAIYAAPTVGRLGILGASGAFNQAACGLVANDYFCCGEFLYLYLLSKRDELNAMASGSAQQNLNLGKIKSYPAFKVSENVMNEFKEVIKPIFAKIKTNSLQIRTLQKLRDTLLPKLMSGEVTVIN